MFTKKQSGLEKVFGQITDAVKKDETPSHKIRNGLIVVAAGSALAAGLFGKSKEQS